MARGDAIWAAEPAETAIGRYKALIGPRLRVRGLATQQGEIALGAKMLNRMIRVAKPVSVRIAGY